MTSRAVSRPSVQMGMRTSAGRSSEPGSKQTIRLPDRPEPGLHRRLEDGIPHMVVLGDPLPSFDNNATLTSLSFYIQNKGLLFAAIFNACHVYGFDGSVLVSNYTSRED